MGVGEQQPSPPRPRPEVGVRAHPRTGCGGAPLPKPSRTAAGPVQDGTRPRPTPRHPAGGQLRGGEQPEAGDVGDARAPSGAPRRVPVERHMLATRLREDLAGGIGRLSARQPRAVWVSDSGGRAGRSRWGSAGRARRAGHGQPVFGSGSSIGAPGPGEAASRQKSSPAAHLRGQLSGHGSAPASRLIATSGWRHRVQPTARSRRRSGPVVRVSRTGVKKSSEHQARSTSMRNTAASSPGPADQQLRRAGAGPPEQARTSAASSPRHLQAQRAMRDWVSGSLVVATTDTP